MFPRSPAEITAEQSCGGGADTQTVYADSRRVKPAAKPSAYAKYLLRRDQPSLAGPSDHRFAHLSPCPCPRLEKARRSDTNYPSSVDSPRPRRYYRLLEKSRWLAAPHIRRKST